ncbi:MAG TPA: hypothetical protein DDW36_04665 [Candidatus Magasanikbacteria bacterium]|nr:hypothetical protein [Candidatus Magasanikbacteria bacterium]
MTQKVGIILINYKDYAERFLVDCRDSIRELEYPRSSFTVYIVDNATTPETEKYLKEQWPEAVIIPNVENAGWGGGNNIGIKRAFADGCDDVVLTNFDTYVGKNWLSELVFAAYSDKKIGIVQSKLFLHPPRENGEFFINSLGNQFHYLGFGFSAGGNMRDGGSIKEVTEITYASGASMYIKGAVMSELGLFEENFFMYHDDLEYCLKARQAEWRIVLAPRSIMYHKHEFMRSNKHLFYMERNRFLVLLYFYRIPTLVLIAPMFLIMELGQWLFALKNGWLGTRIKVYAYFFNVEHLRAAWKRRTELQAQRKLKRDREFVESFADTIQFQEIGNPLLRYIGNPLMHAYWQVAKRLIFW